MALYKVVLAYDGTDFFGYQRQGSARTVQSVVEAALRELGWPGGSLLAAGRTDTGVHALGQVIAFELGWQHSCQELLAALNAHLPQDVAAQAVQEALAGFHPRYAAAARRYRYRIFCSPIRHPLRERYAWRVWPQPELGRLQQSARLLVGKHDFAAFGTPPRTGGSTVRMVTQVAWTAQEDELIFEIVANAFLYHMARRLVFVQVARAQGRLDEDIVLRCLESPAPQPVQGLAPPQGLALVEVVYPTGSPSGGERDNLK